MENEKKKVAFRKMLLRSFSLSAGINSETMQGMGFGFSLLPYLKTLYPDDPKKVAEGLKRESIFFNTYPGSSGYIFGVTAKLEEEYKATGERLAEEQINQVKLALMGPLAGLGDSLMMAVFRIIVTIVGIDFALGRNPMGALFVLFAFHLPYLWVRVKGAYLGYENGPLYLQQYMENGAITELTKWLGQVRAALLGYLVFRGIQIPYPKAMETAIDSMNYMFPNVGAVVLVIAGVFILKKNWGQKTMIGLLVLIAAVLAFFMN